MRCTTCGYSLWNLKDRRCPECGEAFQPSEFDFVPNTVRFGCPECDQAYFGTDPRGQLVPDEFDCVTCGTHLRTDDMVLRPRDGVRDEDTRTSTLPWIERAEIGRWKAFWKTIGASLISPGRLGTGVDPAMTRNGSLRFALLALIPVIVINMLPSLIIAGVMPIAAGGRGGGVAVGVTGLILLASIPLGLVSYLIGFVLWSACAHLILKITGGTAFGFRRTFDTVCFASGANIISAIPCFGGYFGWIWWTVSLAIGLRASQRVSGLRATIAAASFPVLFIGLVIALYAVMLTMLIGARGAAIANLNAMQTNVGTTLNAAVVADPAMFRADQPVHSVKLVTDGQLEPFDLIRFASSQTNIGSVLVDGTGIMSLTPGFSPAPEIVDAAVNSLDPGTVAHRLGDYVFTYHGIDPNADTTNLWIAIATPDPAWNVDAPFFIERFGPRAGPFIDTFTFDGGTQRFDETTWDAALDAQNALRKDLGLPPLDPPELVEHDIPQVLDPDQWPERDTPTDPARISPVPDEDG